MKKNAIILAAGKSSNFAPFIYEKPKGLFRVRGEILIERQIKQLKDASFDIYYCKTPIELYLSTNFKFIGFYRFRCYRYVYCYKRI